MEELSILKLNSFNARGLGDGNKRRCIFQWLRQFHNGITFWQETHSTEAIETKWENEWGGNIKFSHGTCGSRGVAILFPKGLDIQINHKITDTDGRFILLDLVLEDQNVTFVNVYAPTKDKETEQLRFINFIQNNLAAYTDKNLIIGGDLNTCLNPSIDKCGGTKENTSNTAQKYIELCEEYNLIDIWRVINPDSKKYTWRGITRAGLVQSRLDIWLISTHMIYDLKTVDIKPGIKSDHSIIKMQFYIRETQQRGRGFWKFNCSLLKDNKYVEKIKQTLASCAIKYNNFMNKSLLWDVIKCEVRSETISYATWKSKERKKQGVELDKNLQELEKNLNNGLNVYEEYLNAKQELEAFNNDIAKGSFIRSRVRFIEENEKCSKFFLQQEIHNSKTKYIKSLKIGTEYETNPDKILKEEENFYKTLYSKPTNNKICEKSCSLFTKVMPGLNAEEKLLCDRNITIEECGKSLKELQNNKSPGSDGLTTEFYKFFWPDIKDHVFNSFEYAFVNGILSIDQRRAILTILPKPEKDLRLLKNWRPLSLLNTDYKILTKLLATRLQQILPNIINEDQKGCIKGRYIGENIRTILDILQYTNSQVNAGLIMFLDFEKAFDTVSWDFLFQTLKAFNFGETFIKWIEVLYCEPLCCVNNNGYASQFFQLTRGIRQGCPISALLFIMVAEIMSINIRNDDNIKGLTFNNKELKLSQFADDTTLFLKDKKSIEIVLKLLDHFHKCAGLKLNKEKTEAIQLGQSNMDNKNKFDIKYVNGPVKVLGIWVGKDPQEVIIKNFEHKIKKLKKLVNMWKSRNLSIKGKITLLRAQAMPLILYPCTILYVPEEKVKEIDHIFFDFIWPSHKHHVQKNVLIQRIEDGGLKMPDIASMIKSVKLTWVNKLINKANNFTNVAKECTNITNFERFFNYKNDVQFLDKTLPCFYMQVFKHWYELYSTSPETENDILNEKIWLNKYILIEGRPILYKKWENSGIIKLNDIINQEGKFKTVNQLRQLSGIIIDAMMYNGIKSAIPKSWLRKLNNQKQFKTKSNSVTLKINHVEKNMLNLKCKDFYWEYVVKKAASPKCIEKWEELYYYVDFDWKLLFSLPYIVARETKLQSLQYQILNRYIPCKYFLKICNKEENDKCKTCERTEDLEHFFYNCNELGPFWNAFNHWFSNTCEIQIELHSPDIIFGIPNVNEDDILHSLNFCILLAKSYIYKAKNQEQEPLFQKYKMLLKDRLTSEKIILETQEKLHLFEKIWQKVYDSVI